METINRNIMKHLRNDHLRNVIKWSQGRQEMNGGMIIFEIHAVKYYLVKEEFTLIHRH